MGEMDVVSCFIVGFCYSFLHLGFPCTWSGAHLHLWARSNSIHGFAYVRIELCVNALRVCVRQRTICLRTWTYDSVCSGFWFFFQMMSTFISSATIECWMYELCNTVILQLILAFIVRIKRLKWCQHLWINLAITALLWTIAIVLNEIDSARFDSHLNWLPHELLSHCIRRLYLPGLSYNQLHKICLHHPQRSLQFFFIQPFSKTSLFVFICIRESTICLWLPRCDSGCPGRTLLRSTATISYFYKLTQNN